MKLLPNYTSLVLEHNDYIYVKTKDSKFFVSKICDLPFEFVECNLPVTLLNDDSKQQIFFYDDLIFIIGSHIFNGSTVKYNNNIHYSKLVNGIPVKWEVALTLPKEVPTNFTPIISNNTIYLTGGYKFPKYTKPSNELWSISFTKPDGCNSYVFGKLTKEFNLGLTLAEHFIVKDLKNSFFLLCDDKATSAKAVEGHIYHCGLLPGLLNVKSWSPIMVKLPKIAKTICTLYSKVVSRDDKVCYFTTDFNNKVSLNVNTISYNNQFNFWKNVTLPELNDDKEYLDLAFIKDNNIYCVVADTAYYLTSIPFPL